MKNKEKDRDASNRDKAKEFLELKKAGLSADAPEGNANEDRERIHVDIETLDISRKKEDEVTRAIDGEEK